MSLIGRRRIVRTTLRITFVFAEGGRVVRSEPSTDIDESFHLILLLDYEGRELGWTSLCFLRSGLALQALSDTRSDGIRLRLVPYGDATSITYCTSSVLSCLGLIVLEPARSCTSAIRVGSA